MAFEFYDGDDVLTSAPYSSLPPLSRGSGVTVFIDPYEKEYFDTILMATTPNPNFNQVTYDARRASDLAAQEASQDEAGSLRAAKNLFIDDGTYTQNLNNDDPLNTISCEQVTSTSPANNDTIHKDIKQTGALLAPIVTLRQEVKFNNVADGTELSTWIVSGQNNGMLEKIFEASPATVMFFGTMTHTAIDVLPGGNIQDYKIRDKHKITFAHSKVETSGTTAEEIRHDPLNANPSSVPPLSVLWPTAQLAQVRCSLEMYSNDSSAFDMTLTIKNNN